MNYQNNKLRQESGEINLEGKLVSFLYTLMRDHITAGKIEELVREVENENGLNYYTNGWLALYAENLAKRLLNDIKD